ncbi:MAG: hypothetical protein KF908_08210 [Nitrosomonas sp.]|nr:hypothetical protein [Nitrosomonas sp.]MCW5608637.1 hypothetical protein [Nitrosomonas sp.]
MKVSEIQSRNKNSKNAKASTVSGEKHVSDLRFLIEEAAYYEALTRDAVPEHERGDWPAAEQEDRQ